jgi:hypothetical protein
VFHVNRVGLCIALAKGLAVLIVDGHWHWLLMWTGVYAAVVGAHWWRVCQLAVDIGCQCGFAWCIRGSQTRGAHWILTWHVCLVSWRWALAADVDLRAYVAVAGRIGS